MRTVGAAAAALLVAGCAPAQDAPGTCPTFALTLSVDSGGQPDPVAAATWFAVHGRHDDRLPAQGWAIEGQDGTGTTIRSGGSTLHTVRLEDGTWAVDGGSRC